MIKWSTHSKRAGSALSVEQTIISCTAWKKTTPIPNNLNELTKACEAAEAQELAETLARFEIEAPEEGDTGHMSDVEVVDDETMAADGEDSGQKKNENSNLNDDIDF
ncbi:hypothetical protein AAVH_12855 [Aphelenchoides avenae]|nr:hypothetical protein AAVH_12855 [Aphelenchus avenae]